MILIVCPSCSKEFEKTHYKKKYCNHDCYIKGQKRQYYQFLWGRKKGLSRYKLTEDDFKTLLEQQEFKCKICNLKPEKVLCVDHNHETDKVRGLLCRQCNLMLGLAKDNIEILQNSIKYLIADLKAQG